MIYIEPLNTDIRHADHRKGAARTAVLPTLGGQTGLNLAMAAVPRRASLDQYGRQAAGHHPPRPSDKAEDRQGFKDTMESIGQPCIPSKVVDTVEDAVAFAN